MIERGDPQSKIGNPKSKITMMDDLLDQYRERVKAELPPDMMRLQAGYHQAADRIRNPALKMELSDYFVRHWMSKLGPHGTMLVVAFRTLALPSLHRGEAVASVIISRAELVKVTGLSLSTVKRTLQDPVFQEFVKAHERFAADPNTGLRRQVESEYEVFYDDPLLPGDEESLYRELIDRETRRRLAEALGLPSEAVPAEPQQGVPQGPQPEVPTEPQAESPTEPGSDEIRRLLQSRFKGLEPERARPSMKEQASAPVSVLAPESPATLDVLERYRENVRHEHGSGSPSANEKTGPYRRDERVDAYGWADRFIRLTGDKKSERFYIGAARAYLEWDRARGWALLDEVYGTLKLAMSDGKLEKPGAAANGLLRKVAREHGFAATRADRERLPR
jgi:hypothetical protein